MLECTCRALGREGPAVSGFMCCRVSESQGDKDKASERAAPQTLPPLCQWEFAKIGHP